ncbi:MAG: transketolase C-terminal domain-containing protein, partial [Nannocystaceae bacterium]
MSFPIDLSAFRPVVLDPAAPELSAEQATQLAANIQLCRDAIVFFTAVAGARGLGGHTGGAFDIVPEVLIADGLMRHGDSVQEHFFDEAGHRVAIQYLMSVLRGHLPVERLLHYREFCAHLPGHPERDYTPGVTFSSGRLGHMWPYVNGVALAERDKTVFMFGSDGSQMEGNDAEAARLAVAQKLNVKLIIDDNDVTIAGFPSDYMPGFDVAKTLAGHGLTVDVGDGEDLPALYRRIHKAVQTPGPVALINKRKMAVGIAGLEGSNKGHDVIAANLAQTYLEARGHTEAVAYLKAAKKDPSPLVHRGSSEKTVKNRALFGTVVSDLIDQIPEAERAAKVMVIDSDLEGSCGLNTIRARHPDVFIRGGIMERGNYSAAAGFGMQTGRQGIFATFSAFLEMLISEITMARLNKANVLAHLSHSGVDDMADNTCHFGINHFFAANGIPDGDPTRLYFPADAGQMKAVLERVFNDPGQRFVFSTRSAVPSILREDGSPMYGEGYEFTPGRDEVIREGTAGYIVSFGETLYRALDAVETLREQGLDVGLINKCTLNVIDPASLAKIGATGF